MANNRLPRKAERDDLSLKTRTHSFIMIFYNKIALITFALIAFNVYRGGIDDIFLKKQQRFIIYDRRK